MDRDAAHAALRRRLAETHLRAEIYKDKTLQLHREGVSTKILGLLAPLWLQRRPTWNWMRG